MIWFSKSGVGVELINLSVSWFNLTFEFKPEADQVSCQNHIYKTQNEILDEDKREYKYS